jgi:hypothetical protein
LQGADRGRNLVDGVGVAFDQIVHDAHALVEAALHGGHLLLQLLDLSLQLNHFFAHAPCGHGGEAKGSEKG